MKKYMAYICAVTAICMAFSSCGKVNEKESSEKSTEALVYKDTSNIDFSIDENDNSSEYDTESIKDAETSENGFIISSGGTYSFTGKINDETVNVDAPEEEVKIVLDGVRFENETRPAIYVKSAKKVTVTLADSSKNKISCKTYSEDGVDAAIFSKSDLVINGEGSLEISSGYHGIVSKDELTVTGGNINVISDKVAVCGKDCVKINGGALVLDAGTDGIRSDNDKDPEKGFIYICGGNIEIKSEKDGIQAQTVFKSDGGDIKITSGDISSVSDTKTDRGIPGYFPQSGNKSNEESGKGIKADGDIIICGGSFTVSSADDCIHSNSSISISGGNTVLSSEDDGIHADADLIISDGRINIIKSYEGLEAENISVSGGNIGIKASDDGMNGAGKSENSEGENGGMGGGFFGRGRASASGSISISGGYVFVDADGDGLDSNGTLSVSGGTLLVCGPIDSANSAIDYETSGSISGGTVIALGASGMAENFTSAENQGSILYVTENQDAGKSFAVCDSSGKLIASLMPTKAYRCALVSTPEIQKGEKYSLIVGADISGADENGYASGSKISGGTTIAEIEMNSELYSNSNGGFGRPEDMGGQGGFGDRGRDHGGFGGKDGDITPPDMPNREEKTPPVDMPGQDGRTSPPNIGSMV